ncbi:Hypothetical_protein [Hexamita inflata]|uniref:Hypothetical_protein n=1 Tax=Hexamita inflata TaxID=28002 RepID=A0AA86RKN6_9EUKA|nr:Hypothetical protein HINF_LOCUS66072 [Hexamita inflata]
MFYIILTSIITSQRLISYNNYLLYLFCPNLENYTQNVKSEFETSFLNLYSRNCTVLQEWKLQSSVLFLDVHNCVGDGHDNSGGSTAAHNCCDFTLNVPNFNEDVQEALLVTPLLALATVAVNYLLAHSPLTCTQQLLQNIQTPRYPSYQCLARHTLLVQLKISIKVTRSQSPSLWRSDSIEAEFLVDKHSGERVVTLLH